MSHPLDFYFLEDGNWVRFTVLLFTVTHTLDYFIPFGFPSKETSIIIPIKGKSENAPVACHNEKLGILKPQFGASSKQQVDLEIEIVGYLTYLIFQNSRQRHCPEPFRIESLHFPIIHGSTYKPTPLSSSLDQV